MEVSKSRDFDYAAKLIEYLATDGELDEVAELVTIDWRGFCCTSNVAWYVETIEGLTNKAIKRIGYPLPYWPWWRYPS